MTASEPLYLDPWNTYTADTAEMDLQQELRAMFEVDTQQYLQEYFNLVQCLNYPSWVADIQHIYRAVHTIKGGAVTVEADAMLHAGMVLEDLLSDLRYLDQCPDLSDGQLRELLLEAGELLSSSIEIKATGDAAIAQVQPTVERIRTIHELIRQRYLPDWNELKQVHQEFAEQGFDLVVLGLEMALDQLPNQGNIPVGILQTAQLTLAQLTQIGEDLQFAQSWMPLMAECQTLIDQADSTQWKRYWPQYFQILKDCAKQGGEISSALQTRLDSMNASGYEAALEFSVGIPNHPEIDNLETAVVAPEALWLEDLSEFEGLTEFDLTELAALTPTSLEAELNGVIANVTAANLPEWLDDRGLDDLALEGLMPEDVIPSLEQTLIDEICTDLPLLEPLTLSLDPTESLSISLEGLQDWNAGSIDDFSDFSALAAFNSLEDVELLTLNEENWAEPGETFSAEATLGEMGLFPQAVAQPQPVSQSDVKEAAAPEAIAAETKRSVQVSVPLERLDRSAQQVVETLLTARGVINSAQKLETQLAQITSLTQESAQFITRLRQIQDDYALLRTLNDQQDDSSNVNLERYRQGYTTINRLLENILRMSELGQEIETVTQQNASRLDKLDRSILRLKDGIETSRLVPFRNLSLRARAIVRDLSNRYGKPVELLVQGEQVELDAGILQQLEPALLHLLRNAYDHGLESVETRLNQGKPAQGTLQLSLHRRGNLYRLVLKDDGSGIDGAEIAQLAQSKGFALNQARTNTELLAVLCQPGFSSRSAVTEVSGRGVGMDVVASQIAAINGKFSLETRLGEGTTFSIEVPAPQLLVSCVLMEVGDRTIALPTDEILETILIDPAQIAPLAAENPQLTWMLQTHRGAAPGFDLANYWLSAEQSSAKSTVRALGDTAIAIRTRSADRSGSNPDLWFIADDLLGQEELLINPLPSPLIAPAGLLGVSLQSDGRLISILDPISLITAIESAPTAKATQAAKASRPKPIQSVSKKILVVDDAALMRRRLEGSLSSNGFTIFTCGDGLEAWNWLQANECPDLIITDVEMPQMDGFTLIDRCRQSGLELPILVVSSRLSEEWGKEARRLGASDYLNKGFSTPELLSKVNQLLGASILALT
jgi:chemotaxis protein histidine kinase CheA